MAGVGGPALPGLAGAQLGYEYQDIVGASLLAVGLVQGLESLGAEVPTEADTFFDDLERRDDFGTVRWQVKHSADENRKLKLSDLRGAGELSLGRMISPAAGVPSAADQFRVLLTWQEPTDEHLTGMLVPVDVGPSLPGQATRTYGLDPEWIWPTGGDSNPILELPDEIQRSAVEKACENLIVEFGAPRSSLQRGQQGLAEQWLLTYLEEQVGVDRVPNDLPPDYAADLLIRLVTQARPRFGPIEITEARQRLQLRDSFGRLEQLSPVEPAIEVRRRRAGAAVLRMAAANPVTIITAGPGLGKSWAIEEIERLARRQGAAVARHYSYLRPDDTSREERVRGDQMIISLVADLLEQAPELGSVGPHYAADLRRLEALLDANSEEETPREILLVVDGLDHVGRIRAQSRDLSDADADLIERLASLRLADHAHLLVLSQPGDHLEPLEESGTVMELPTWQDDALDSLCRRLGLEVAKFPEGAEPTVEVARRLSVERAAGSPLYCTYVARELIGLLQGDPQADVEGSIERMPPAGADLAAYYEYLLDHAEAVPAARRVAYLFALVDFGLTADDLREIVGQVDAPEIEGALAALRPLLSKIGTEDAFRVHHESFQRFVIDRLATEEITAAAVLEPMVDWLESRGFLSDLRAFRYLLPALRRSDRASRVLELVSSDFVVGAIANGHPYLATKANIDSAAAAAGELFDLPSLAKCGELARTAVCAYDEKLRAIEKYASAMAKAQGEMAMAERLIYEGRPTWPRRSGLQLCQACDLAGGVPPWREYLTLPREVQENLMGDDESEEAADRCGWLGQMRLAEDPMREAESLLHSEIRSIDSLREMLRYLGVVCGADSVAALPSKLLEGTPRLAGWLETAKAYDADRREEKRNEAAQVALTEEGPAIMLNEAIELGADPLELLERVGSLEDLLAQATELSAVDFIHESEPVESYRLCLRVHAAAGSDLTTVREAIQGTTWWPDWLRFCVDEAAGGVDGDPLAALRRLALNAHPFTGEPRAIDLYALRDQTAASINTMATKVTVEQREQTLAILAELASKTGGAYNRDSLLTFCESHLADDPELFGNFALEQIHQSATEGEHLYEEAAELSLRMASIHLRRGEEKRAQVAWLEAARYLAGYGFRKDITLYELLDSLDDLGRATSEGASRRAIQVQPYASLVVHHTDGKETARLPSVWFRKLSELDPSVAAQCLASTFRRGGGSADYRVEEGLGFLQAAASEGDPRLLEAIGATTGGSIAERRYAVERLLEISPEEGEEGLRRLIAAADGDAATPDEEAVDDLIAFADDRQIATDELIPVAAAREATHKNDYGQRRQGALLERNAFFPANASVTELLYTLRTVRFPDKADEQERFVLGLGYRLLQLAQEDRREVAERLLRTFARKRFLEGGDRALELLGEGLERHGENSLAAQALTLSWTAARPGWWRRTGGAELAERVARARQLDTEISNRALAVELTEIIRTEPGQYGLAQGVIGLLASTNEVGPAEATWDAAASVIFNRLPATGQESDYFAAACDQDPNLDLNSSLAYLLAARLCHPRWPIGREALTGLARVSLIDRQGIEAALSFLLVADTPIFALQAGLRLTLEGSYAAEIGQALEEPLSLLAETGGQFLSPLAAKLLEAAGLPVPEVRGTAGLALPTLAVGTGPTAQAILSLDREGRIEQLEALYPNLKEDVVAAFERHSRSSEKVFNRQEKRRWRLVRNISGNLPQAEVRLWGEEILDVAIEEALAPRLGEEDEGSTARILDQDVDTVVRWVNSRTPRPTPPPGAEIDPEPLAAGRYAGWWRLAWAEEELQVDDPLFAENVQKQDRMGAVLFSDHPLQAGALPFGRGDPTAWAWAGRRPGTFPRIVGGTAISGLNIDGGRWGRRILLMLPPTLNAAFPLSLDPGKRFALLDADDREAVRYRRWWVRALREDDAAAWVPVINGCDLIVREDIWRQISDLAEERPYWSQHESE